MSLAPPVPPPELLLSLATLDGSLFSGLAVVSVLAGVGLWARRQRRCQRLAAIHRRIDEELTEPADRAADRSSEHGPIR